MDYRSVPESHRDAFFDAVRYAFRPEDGPEWDRPDDDEDRPTPMTLRGMYDTAPGTPADDLSADDLRATGGYYDFTSRIRGDWHTAGGVSVVTSDPTTRRSGVVATLLDEMLAEFRDDGTAFSVLWPFEYEFYRRFGWAKANDYARITLPPDALAAVAPDPAGEFVRLDADDWERLASVHDRWATETLAVRRSEEFWRGRLFASWRSDPYVYGWERDGDLRGYLLYRVEDGDGDGKTMAVEELAGVDREATDHLLRFCRNHDSQVESVRLRTGVDTSLLDRLSDPRAAEFTVHPGPMVRVVDVAAALSAVSYPPGVEGTVTLDVSDPRCAWNDGRFELAVSDGTGSVTRPEGGDDPASSAVALGVGPLSQLVVGALAAETLVEYGDATVAGDGGVPAERCVETLDALFPPTPVSLREGF